MGGDNGDGIGIEGSVVRQHGGLADEWLPPPDDKIYGALTYSGIEPSTAVGLESKKTRNKKTR